MKTNTANRKSIALFFAIFFYCISATAQTGTLKGKIFSAINNEPLPFASVQLQGTALGATCDSAGNYTITNIPASTYNITGSFAGHKQKTVFELAIPATIITYLDIALDKEMSLSTVTVKSSPFTKTRESPVSLKTISASEIERNPSGNRDITKAIQSFPGVASSVSFRNDLIIRGGASSENKFYLDGVEVPTINHFTTQGATGGAFGMINVNMIREVNFLAGAFPASRGNTLSSLFEFKQKDGSKDKMHFTVIAGLIDVAFMANGPIGKKTTFNSSLRQSNTKVFAKAFGAPIIPVYNDFQFKTRTKLGAKDEISFIGLGAYDVSTLNKDYRNGLSYKNSDSINKLVYETFRNTLPINTQYNFTLVQIINTL